MAGLATYRKKRPFEAPPEPRGKRGRAGHTDVMPNHAARRLHYDRRLQLGGVMTSWAVTLGPRPVPGEKRLAVAVEDHPLAYNTLEGTIPQGDAARGMRKGCLSFRLDSDKLQDDRHLVRVCRQPGETRDNWFLIKRHDAAARRAQDKDILREQPLSVKSDRSMEEIAQGRKTRKRSKRQSGKRKTSKRRR